MEPPSLRQIPTRTLHRPGQRIVLFVVGSLFALMGAGMLISGDAADPASVVLFAVIAAGGVWIAIRSCVMGVRIDSMGLTERGLGRSKVVPWCAVGAVNTGDGPGLAPTEAPGLVLRDGEKLGPGALASYSRAAVEADFTLIKSLHATHVTDCPNCA